MTNDFLQSLKILYVEDDPAIREGLSKFLARRTSLLTVAEDGVSGLALFHETSPDIIITDIRMPNMTGLEMIEHIREVNAEIPIIITTGHSDEEFYQRALDLDVDKYIKKPVNLKDLVSVITRVAKSTLQQREIEAQRELVINLLDINPNLMMITDGQTITYLNKAMLSFAGVSSCEEFIEKHGLLDGLLVPYKDAFYKNKMFAEWTVVAIDAGPTSKLVLYLQDPSKPDGDTSVFLANVNKLPAKSEYLFSFSDITTLEREKLYYQDLAQFDDLTKIYNRLKFNTELEKEIARVRRYKMKLSAVMFDVDFFKNVNDTYGHTVGDVVLQDITKVVNGCIRKSDIFCRYGGEEFILLMPETDVKAACDTAERIRKAIEKYNFCEAGRVTCSFGVAEYSVDETSLHFIKRSDDALYTAKHNGRNRVEVDDIPVM